MMTLSREGLLEFISYDDGAGIFTWKERARRHFKSDRAFKVWNSRFTGKIAGNISTGGYRTIRINGTSYRANRLAFLYMTGRWPEEVIDHINRCASDDRFCNLREASHSQNSGNAKLYRSNTSGYRGVCFETQSQKWMATIKLGRIGSCKRIFLGRYENKEDAARAYNKYAEQHFGEFYNGGDHVSP